MHSQNLDVLIVAQWIKFNAHVADLQLNVGFIRLFVLQVVQDLEMRI